MLIAKMKLNALLSYGKHGDIKPVQRKVELSSSACLACLCNYYAALRVIIHTSLFFQFFKGMLQLYHGI